MNEIITAIVQWLLIGIAIGGFIAMIIAIAPMFILLLMPFIWIGEQIGNLINLIPYFKPKAPEPFKPVIEFKEDWLGQLISHCVDKALSNYSEWQVNADTIWTDMYFYPRLQAHLLVFSKKVFKGINSEELNKFVDEITKESRKQILKARPELISRENIKLFGIVA